MENTTQKLKPLFDRVLLAHEAEQHQNGIIIPREFTDRAHIMTVVDAGQSTQLKSGDRVIIAKYSGTDVTLGTNKYTLVTEYDVLGVIS